jgi:hypothetical protein
MNGSNARDGGIGNSGADDQRELPPPLWPGGTLLPGLIDEFTTTSKQPSTFGASVHRPAISGVDFPGLASPPRWVKFDLLSVCRLCDDSHPAVSCPRHRQRGGGSGGYEEGEQREGGRVRGGVEGAGLQEWGSILPSPGDVGSRRSRDSDGRKAGGHRAADAGVWGGLAFWVGKGLGAWELQTKGMRAREVDRGP